MVKPRTPIVFPPDEDPTGVRALLSSLPAPNSMPNHLVDRINASLAAEQAQRAANAPGTSVTPLRATTRRHPGRLLFAMAGAAAAIALVSVVGNNSFRANQITATADGSTAASTSSSRELSNGAPANPLKAVPDKTPPPSGDLSVTGGQYGAKNLSDPAPLEIRISETRYTQADFMSQARTLRGAKPISPQPRSLDTALARPAGTPAWLTACLDAIGASEAQAVRADVAFYEGQPAVIIVTTTNGVPTAYAVKRRCSHADATVLRPATLLP